MLDVEVVTVNCQHSYVSPLDEVPASSFSHMQHRCDLPVPYCSLTGPQFCHGSPY